MPYLNARFLFSDFLLSRVLVFFGGGSGVVWLCLSVCGLLAQILTASKTVTQTVQVVRSSEKWDLLCALLKDLPKDHKTLVFSATKVGCNQVADALWKAGGAVDALHGDKMQWERTACLDKFRKVNSPTSVCIQ